MYRKQVRRRRAVLVGLIVGSLVLLSAHFSEAESGPLHVIQRATATVLSPLEAVANAALKPARDAVDWFDETWEARGENEDLREELAEVRAQLAEAELASAENDELRGLLGIEKDELAGFGFEPGNRHASSPAPPSLVNATVGVNAGSGDGVEVDDAVIAADGLVGRVTQVTSTSAQVQLITDPRNGVSVAVAEAGRASGNRLGDRRRAGGAHPRVLLERRRGLRRPVRRHRRLVRPNHRALLRVPARDRGRRDHRGFDG